MSDLVVDSGASETLSVDAAMRLFRWILASRRIDELERELVARGEAFFHVSAAGHEASSALACFLTPEDYLHLHYRDKALMLARGMPVREFFDSLVCNAESHSGGRQMSAHFSVPALNILSVVGPVGNNALQAVGIAQQIIDLPTRPIVVCSLGDGTTQQGEVLEAIAEAVRSSLPVLFLVHDNHYAISTRTAGQTFFSRPDGDAASFYGLPIHRVDGTCMTSCHQAFGRLVGQLRRNRGPILCLMAVERLCSHTNADDESVYREQAELGRVRQAADPLHNTRRWLLAQGVPPAELTWLHDDVDAAVRAAAETALDQPAPIAADGLNGLGMSRCADRKGEYCGNSDGAQLTMAEALRETLRARMAVDPRVTLYGQDIEDPKGDVLGVTRGLTQAFPGRVRNSPLSESTIIGTSIGRALAGGRPVAFLQFADFLPLAFNQLATELASMDWRTRGGWRAPVIVMVSCGAYRPGLGPFHAHTFESLVAHLPGIDVVMPATAGDAAGMLNAAFDGGRPTVVFYPKALLNDRTHLTSTDVISQWVPVGAARVLRAGRDITLVGWGNTVRICEKVADALDVADVQVEVIDLRWISPWDREAVVRSVRRTRRLLVVHEDNQTAGFGAEVVATVAEHVAGGIACRRVTRPDTFVPCNFGNQLEVLPSYRRTLEVAAEMLSLDVHWESGDALPVDRQVVHVIGSSPADQTVEVVELPILVGAHVKAGQTLASLEADKAVVDLAAPADGVVESIHLGIGDRASVGAPLLTLRGAQKRPRPLISEPPLKAILVKRPTQHMSQAQPGREAAAVVLRGLGAVPGREHLDNRELARLLPSLASPDGCTDGILERTGIESRLVASADQDVVGMAVEAAGLALRDAGLEARDLALVICSTSTPVMTAPSTACQVLHRLAPGVDVPAYDLVAACSGYLYALANAWDFLQQRKEGHVLVVTTEVMRRIVDIHDPQTSPIFGDAATATVLSVKADADRSLATLLRPVIGAHGDDGQSLRVPTPAPGAFVHMDGKRVFAEAIRSMGATLTEACARSGLALDDIDLVVPHQANGRMIEALRTRLGLPRERVWNEIRFQGNTSSSSIPLSLHTVLRGASPGQRIGLCAFGAGQTFGGAVLIGHGRADPSLEARE